MKIKIKDKLLILILFISIVRVILGYLLPSYYFGVFYHDDLLSLNISESLYNLDWFGDYSSTTLVKGFIFPLLMAFFKFFKINIGLGLTTLFVLSCFLFCFVIKDFFKNKKSVYILYLLLIFNPISFSAETFQRLYRNSITYTLVLFVLSFLFLILKTKLNDKKIYLYLTFLGLSLTIFFFSREDCIWIIPVILFIFILKILYEFSLINFFKLLIPVIVVIFFQLLIKEINYSYYDAFTLNELKSSNYKNAYLELLKIKPEKYYNRISIPTSSLLVALKNSPTLATLKGELLFSVTVNNENRGGMIDGYMLWNLRYIAQEKGIYKTYESSEEFWGKVYNELKDARLNKKYESRTILPSILISPLNKNNLINFLNTLPKTFVYVFTYDDFKTYSYNDLYKSDMIKIKETTFYRNSFNLKIDDNKATNNLGNINNDFISSLFNYITLFYSCFSMIFNVFGIFCFLILLFNKKFKKIILPISMLLCFFTLICGVTYTHVCAFDSIRYFYLSSAYILFIIFSFDSIFFLLEEVNYGKFRFNNFNALFKRG